MFVTVTYNSNNHHLESVVCLNTDATNLLELRKVSYIYITLLNMLSRLVITYFPRSKDSDAGRDWGQEKGTTEDEMAGWHH